MVMASNGLVLSLTCLKGVVDFSIGALVLVQSSDLYHLGAYSGRIQGLGLVVDAGELGRVDIAVFHVDDDPGKVPLDGDFLVPHLEGTEGLTVLSGVSAPESLCKVLVKMNGPHM